MGNDTNKYGINTHENKSMSNLNCFNYQENSPNIYLFPYMVHEHHFFFSLSISIKKKKRKKWVHYHRVSYYCYLYDKIFPLKRYPTQSLFSKQTAFMWPNILWVGLEDAGLGLITMMLVLGWWHWAPSAEKLHWNGLEASQINWL